jgi:Flp pilus assembly protein TadD
VCGIPCTLRVIILSALIAFVAGCGAPKSSPMEDPSLDLDSARRRHAETMAAQSASGKTNPDRGDEPKTFDAKMEAGDQLRAQGDVARALWAYIQALELEPESVEPRTRIGLLQLESDPDRAAAIFSEVIEKNPDSSAAHFGLGLAYIARSQPEKAFLELVRADELQRNNPAILAARGSLEEQLGRRDSALALLRRAYELRPTDPNILNNFAVTLLLDEQIELATEILEHATLLHPDDLVLQNNLGLAYGLDERYGLAFKAFSKSANPRNAHNNLGYVYFLNGKLDAALAEYEKALVMEGEDNLTVLQNIEAVVAAQEAQSPAAAATE